MIRKLKRILIWTGSILFIGYGFWKYTYVMLLLLGIIVGIITLLVKFGRKLEEWYDNIGKS